MAVRTINFYGAYSTPFRPFILTVDSGADARFTIPTTGGGYNYSVNTSDGQFFNGLTGNQLIIFPLANTLYDIEIRGLFPRIYVNNNAERLKVKEVKQWGSVIFSSFESAFLGCLNISIPISEVPNVVTGASAMNMFYGSGISQDLKHLPFSKFSTIRAFVGNADSFNSDISDIDLTLISNTSTGIDTLVMGSDMFANGGARFRLDILNKSMDLGTYPFNGTLLTEIEFKNARNLTWSSLHSGGSGFLTCEVFVLQDYATSLDLSATSNYNMLPSLTGAGVKEFVDNVDKTFAGIVKVYPAVYTRFNNYVISLGYSGVANYLTVTSNSWTVTF